LGLKNVAAPKQRKQFTYQKIINRRVRPQGNMLQAGVLKMDENFKRT